MRLLEGYLMSFSGGSDGKESSCNAGETSLIPGFGKSPAEMNGYPPQYSCLENSLERGAWRAIVHGVAKSQIWLKQLSTRTQGTKILQQKNEWMNELDRERALMPASLDLTRTKPARCWCCHCPLDRDWGKTEWPSSIKGGWYSAVIPLWSGPESPSWTST